MRLNSPQGHFVDLQIVGYEFASHTADACVECADLAAMAQTGRIATAFRCSHANWLMISGRVRADDGPEWVFQHPCLLTHEAHDLVQWFQALADGLPDDGDLLVFTEPHLGFSAPTQTSGLVEVKIHLSSEALPQDLRVSAGLWDFSVTIPMTRRDLAMAAQLWKSEADRFPPR